MRTLASLDTAFLVESKDEDTLTWLDELLVPWFDSSPGPRELPAVVRHSHDAEPSVRAGLAEPRRRPVFLLESRVSYLPARAHASGVVLDDGEEGCRYVLDGVEVRVEATSNPGRLRLMRVIREIALEHERRHGHSLELHAAAFELDGKAIALAGPKGSGKTTLLLHALDSAGLIHRARGPSGPILHRPGRDVKGRRRTFGARARRMNRSPREGRAAVASIRAPPGPRGGAP